MNRTAKSDMLLLAVSFAANMGIGLLNFGLLFYLSDRFGTSPSAIGWINSLWAAAYLAGCVGLRSTSSYLAPRKAIALSSGLMALSAGIILTAGSEWLVIVAYGFFGFVTALFWPPVMGWLSGGKEDTALNRTLGMFNLSWSSGVAVAPYIGGLLLVIRLRLPLALATFLYIAVSLAFLSAILFFPGFRAPIEDREGEKKTAADNSTWLRYCGWAGVLSAYLLHGAVIFIFPLYSRSQLGYSEPLIGFLLFLRAAAAVSGFWYSRKYTWWHFRPFWIMALQLALVLCGILFIVSANPLAYALSFIAFGFVFALQYTNSIFHGVAGSINRETRMAIHESFLTIGLVTGSGGAGFIYETWSMNAAFGMSSLAVFSGLLIQAGIYLFHKFPGPHP